MGKVLLLISSMLIGSTMLYGQANSFGPEFKNAKPAQRSPVIKITWTSDASMPTGPEFKTRPVHEIRKKDNLAVPRTRKRPKATYGPRAKNRKPWG